MYPEPLKFPPKNENHSQTLSKESPPRIAFRARGRRRSPRARAFVIPGAGGRFNQPGIFVSKLAVECLKPGRDGTRTPSEARPR